MNETLSIIIGVLTIIAFIGGVIAFVFNSGKVYSKIKGLDKNIETMGEGMNKRCDKISSDMEKEFKEIKENHLSHIYDRLGTVETSQAELRGEMKGLNR